MVPLPVTLSDLWLRFQDHGVIFRPIDALNVLCAQLTRDLFVIATFLFRSVALCASLMHAPGDDDDDDNDDDEM